jgi:hypothetical protein
MPRSRLALGKQDVTWQAEDICIVEHTRSQPTAIVLKRKLPGTTINKEVMESKNC